jgi:hypothetical protein
VAYRNGGGRNPETQEEAREFVIHAELAWDDHATACGIVARSSSPVLKLCRLLVDAGHDPATPLEAWRGGTLCLRVRSIGEAAGLRVNNKGTGFIRAAAVPTAPLGDANATDDPAATPTDWKDWPPADDTGAA